MKVIIAIPCMQTVDSNFMLSLTSVLLNSKNDIAIDVLTCQNSLVYEGRNQLAQAAANSDADYVLWLDSDMHFKPHLLDELLKHKKDFVTALCFRRKPPYSPTIWSKLRFDPEKVVEEQLQYPEDELFEIEGCGAAVMLTSVKVLQDCLTEYNNCFQPLDGFSEDLSFCIRARSLGYKIYCDSSQKTGHTSQAVVTEDTFKAYLQAISNKEMDKGN